MNLAIQDGQKTREGPLVEAGICTVSGKERKGFLKRGDQIVLGGRYRRVGIGVGGSCSEEQPGHDGSVQCKVRKSDAEMSCKLKGWVSPQWGNFIETEPVASP